MDKNSYQLNYASSRPQMYDRPGRVARGKRIVKLLEIHLGKNNLKKLKILDIGSSTGIIDNEIAKKVGFLIGCDIDQKAVDFANKNFKRKNLTFTLGDAMKMKFKDNSFDVVICAQVYEHVPIPKKMFSEIYRVLKPGGVCYLAALNKYWPIEPHYNLPFLSWIPKWASNLYLRALGKGGSYYETLLSYWQLEKLVSKFKKTDYTGKILSNPKKYGYKNKAIILPSFTKYLSPTFFWILEKEIKN